MIFMNAWWFLTYETNWHVKKCIMLGCNLSHPGSTITMDPQPRKASMEEKKLYGWPNSLGAIIHNRMIKTMILMQVKSQKKKKRKRFTLNKALWVVLMKTSSFNPANSTTPVTSDQFRKKPFSSSNGFIFL